MEKYNISISEIHELEARRRVINSCDLRDITFLDENDEPVVINQKILEDFRFTGLHNIDFIMSEFYKRGFDEKL